MAPITQLSSAPATVMDESGEPRFGTYLGPFETVNLRGLRAPFGKGPIDRVRHLKKWVYGFAADDRISVLCAIVETGYIATAFVAVTDLRSGDVIVDRSVLAAPGPLVRVSDQPAHGLNAALLSPLGTFRTRRPARSDHYRVTVSSTPPVESVVAAVRPATDVTGRVLGALPLVGDRLRGLVVNQSAGAKVSLDLRFAAGRTPVLSVVAPVEHGGGTINVTQKVAGLPVTGVVTVGGRTWQIEDGVGGFDYAHGYLARHTSWNWAFACGHLPDGSRLGLNLVSGFNESRPDVNENALWLGDRLIPLDRAVFAFDRDDPMSPWALATADGSVELTFTPYAVHAERKDLVVLTSRFVQPIGRFSGLLRVDDREIAVAGLPGVTEDQDISW